MTPTATQREVFTKVFSYLPHPCASVWIAGGVVVDYDTATDIDVFFGRSNGKAAFEFLHKLPYNKEEHTNYVNGELKVFGEAYVPGINKAIQIMVTKAETADKGLLGIDISTCRWAVLSKGLLEVKGKDATASNQPPIVLKASDKTLGRYIKYCNRFGHPIDVEQVKRCIEIVAVIKLKKKKIISKTFITKEFMDDWATKAVNKPSPLYQAFTGSTTQQVEYYYKSLSESLEGPKPDPQAQANWNAQMLPTHYKEDLAAASKHQYEILLKMKELEQPSWKVTPTSPQYAKEAKTIEKLLPALALDKESK